MLDSALWPQARPAGGRRVNDAEQVAIAPYPELRRLAELRDGGGWRFVHQESEPGWWSRLIELPPPGDPRAPQLVVRSRLPRIWLPGT